MTIKKYKVQLPITAYKDDITWYNVDRPVFGLMNCPHDEELLDINEDDINILSDECWEEWKEENWTSGMTEEDKEDSEDEFLDFWYSVMSGSRLDDLMVDFVGWQNPEFRDKLYAEYRKLALAECKSVIENNCNIIDEIIDDGYHSFIVEIDDSEIDTLKQDIINAALKANAKVTDNGTIESVYRYDKLNNKVLFKLYINFDQICEQVEIEEI